MNENLCPLCQSQNLCGVNNKKACWCSKIHIPSELIDTLPNEVKNKACLCQKCVAKFQSAKFIEIN